MDEGRAARIFLAVGISSAIADHLTELQRAIGRGAPAGLFRFVDAHQAHVTLRFLGQRSSEEQIRVAHAGAAVARTEAPFAVTFARLGVFPDERRPHTLWMGLEKGKQALVALAAKLDAELGGAGFEPEGRTFVPHLTVARIKYRPPPGMVKKLLAGEIDESGAPLDRGSPGIESELLRVDSFALMESRAGGSGVRYVPLHVFRLENACTPSK